MSRPTAYEGNEPYIFVSYCHRDEGRVLPFIEGLQRRGMRVWYDEGIEVGSHWDEEIFKHLKGSTHIIAFFTKHFIQSENCMDEIHFAKEKCKGPLILYLDDMELPEMMQYRYGRLQAMCLTQFENSDDFLDTLCRVSVLSCCRGAASQPLLSTHDTPYPLDFDPEQANNEGLKYFRQQDYTEALKWFHMSAARGYSLAEYNIGICYENGHGVAQNFTEGVKWYRKSAEHGFADAQCNLGFCYFNGQGVPKDKAEAAFWFRKAAEQGFVRAQYNLGVCYDHGHGVAQDISEAINWFRKAAAQGHARAQETLKSKGITW